MSRIDDLFKDKLATYEPTGAAPGWEALKAKQGGKRKKKLAWLPLAAGLALLIMAAWWLGRPTAEVMGGGVAEAGTPAPLIEVTSPTGQEFAASETPANESLPENGVETKEAVANEAMLAQVETAAKTEEPVAQEVNVEEAAPQLNDVAEAQSLAANAAVAGTAEPTAAQTITTETIPAEVLPIVDLSHYTLARRSTAIAGLSRAKQVISIESVAIEGVIVSDSITNAKPRGLLSTLKNFRLGDLRQAKDELYAKATSIEITNPLKNSK